MEAPVLKETRVDIVGPDLGESACQEITLNRWLVPLGARVGPEDVIAELSTEKVSFELGAPAAGFLVEKRVEAGAAFAAGKVVGVVSDRPLAGIDGDAAFRHGSDRVSEESPGGASAPRGRAGVPRWYAVFYQYYQPLWWLGTTLIVASWVGWVAPFAGWLGFGLAGFVTLGSVVLPRLAGLGTEANPVVLDSRLLRERGPEYQEVMDHFGLGRPLTYDGCGFRLRSGHALECGVVSPSLDRAAAERAVGHAHGVFVGLVEGSPEFAAVAEKRRLEISVLPGFDSAAEPTWRWVDGHLEKLG